MRLLTFNKAIVPWTTPWTGEDCDLRVEHEHFTQGMLAFCQKEAPGEGRPVFGSAHAQRQRKAIIQERCDVCGGVIRRGQARVLLHPGERLKGTNIIGHVMAPSHRACAKIAAQQCPWLQRQISMGELVVTVVRKSHVQLAILDPEIVEASIGRRVSGSVVGHAKLVVEKALHRDADWLMRDVIP